VISETQALAALPDRGWLRRYVDYAISITDANAAYHIAAGLALLSQTLPISFLIPDGKIRGNFYALIVGPSTKSRKTTAVKIASSILSMAAPERIMASPGSEQRFIDSLVENPQQLLFVGEGGPFFSSMETGYLRVLKDRITEVYDCGRIARETVSNKKSQGRFQDNPRFSILVGIADAYLEGHTSDEDWMSGMLARFFTVYAQRERTRKKIGSNKEEEQTLANTLKDYATLGQQLAGGDMFAPRVADCLGFDDEATAIWERWFDETSVRKGSRTVEATIERSQDMAWKIAGLLAWDYGQARSGSDWYITADCLKPALAMTELHIASAITIGDTLSTDRDMRILRRVYQSIGDAPTPISSIFRGAQVTSRIGEEMIKTLLVHKKIQLAEADGGERKFTKTIDIGAMVKSGSTAAVPVMMFDTAAGDLFGENQTPVTEVAAKAVGDLFGET
jgi:hypothetical protein